MTMVETEMAHVLESSARAQLDASELDALRPLAKCQTFEDGDVVFRAGDAEIDLFVVESGGLNIYNPADGNKLIVQHQPGDFAGDIDILTRRPVIVTAVARGRTGVLRVPGPRLREMLTKVPMLSGKLLAAFQERRRLLAECGVLGLKVVGAGACRDTTVVREFLHKNFVPFTWYDTTSEQGAAALKGWGSPKKFPVIELGDGKLLLNPGLRELAHAAGVWRDCPIEPVELVVVGAGPAGLAASVYAASEGISTMVIDRLGPGGQAGSSSRIENFIGFPSGLSGMDFAMRGVLQMLKFGAKIATPVNVDSFKPATERGGYHTLHLDCGASLKARTILVATGVAWRKLDARGADKYERAGVYYACTAVEAMLHDGDDVAVVGAGNSAGQAAMYLAECCPKRHVHLLVRSTLGPNMSEYLVNRIRAAKNITVHEGVVIDAVSGGRKIEEIEIKSASRSSNGAATKGSDGAANQRLKAGAVFVFIGADPQCPWLPDSVARDKLGYILTGAEAVATGKWPCTHREPCPLETTLPGVLAAGDVRAGSTKRVGFAVGDGSLACACVHKLAADRP